MPRKTIDTFTCEVCGAEEVIDWDEFRSAASLNRRNKIVAEWRKWWLGVSARVEYAHTDEGLSAYSESPFVCPSLKCRRSAILGALDGLRKQIEEGLEALDLETAASVDRPRP